MNVCQVERRHEGLQAVLHVLALFYQSQLGVPKIGTGTIFIKIGSRGRYDVHWDSGLLDLVSWCLNAGQKHLFILIDYKDMGNNVR